MFCWSRFEEFPLTPDHAYPRTMVVTEQCLLSHTRNPHLDREGIERELKVSAATARLYMHTDISCTEPIDLQ